MCRFRADHPNISEVFYTGLPTHPKHNLAKKTQHGFGGIISCRVKGDAKAVDHILRSTKLFSLAESLGGFESLIEHPATMSHFSMGEELRAKAGITDDIIRISVGIEHINDLISDLEQALNFKSVESTFRKIEKKEPVFA